MRDHFHEGFPSGRTAADAAFNPSYNASWIRLNSNKSHRDGRQHARSCDCLSPETPDWQPVDALATPARMMGPPSYVFVKQ
jgi:hypothetical protein